MTRPLGIGLFFVRSDNNLVQVTVKSKKDVTKTDMRTDSSVDIPIKNIIVRTRRTANYKADEEESSEPSPVFSKREIDRIRRQGRSKGLKFIVR